MEAFPISHESQSLNPKKALIPMYEGEIHGFFMEGINSLADFIHNLKFQLSTWSVFDMFCVLYASSWSVMVFAWMSVLIPILIISAYTVGYFSVSKEIDTEFLSWWLEPNTQGIVLLDYIISLLLVSPTLLWFFAFSIAYSPRITQVDKALLTIRIVGCITMEVSLVAIITHYVPLQLKWFLVTLFYSFSTICYSWIVPIWHWLTATILCKGLICFFPRWIQYYLTTITPLQFITNPTFLANFQEFYPFIFKLDSDEVNRAVLRLPSRTRQMITQPGLLQLFPASIQQVLLPQNNTSKRSVMNNQYGIIKPSFPDLSSTLSYGFNFDESSVGDSTIKKYEENHDQHLSESTNFLREIVMRRLSRIFLRILFCTPQAHLNRTVVLCAILVAFQTLSYQNSRNWVVRTLCFQLLTCSGTLGVVALSIRLLQLYFKNIDYYGLFMERCKKGAIRYQQSFSSSYRLSLDMAKKRIESGHKANMRPSSSRILRVSIGVFASVLIYRRFRR